MKPRLREEKAVAQEITELVAESGGRVSWDLALGSVNASSASPSELPSLPQAVPTRSCFCGPDHEPNHLVSLMAAFFLSTCSLEGKLPEGRIRAVHTLPSSTGSYHVPVVQVPIGLKTTVQDKR